MLKIDLKNKISMWNSFMGSLKVCLDTTGFKNYDCYKIMGISGMAFNFVMSTKCDASGPTVYDWGNSHFYMLDRLGIISEYDQIYSDGKLNTFIHYRNNSTEKIKKSLNAGIPVIAWAPSNVLEFGVIYGYDDSDKVFFIQDVYGGNSDPLLYDNLGVSNIPYLYLHYIKGFVEINTEKAYRESLEYGLKEWKREYSISPYYGSGIKAYDNIINALSGGIINDFGFCYCMKVYSESKKYIYQYLKEISEKSSEIKIENKLLGNYKFISETFTEISNENPFTGKGNYKIFNREKLAKTFSELRKTEDESFGIIANILNNF
ncbi:MAG: hypothetical protein H7A31_03500 [Thermotogae bacterium]|nr:hypothetical protein [Thermotogota bacterium]MCP5465742.1 hypothetical protein [Thermotogota bacterium]